MSEFSLDEGTLDEYDTGFVCVEEQGIGGGYLWTISIYSVLGYNNNNNNNNERISRALFHVKHTQLR